MPPVLILTPARSLSPREGWLTPSVRRCWRALTPLSLREHVHAWRQERRARRRRRTVHVPIDRLLLGDQGRLSASRFAQQSGRLLHPSSPLVDSPYADFLRDHDRHGDAILTGPRFQQTSYHQFIAECFRVGGGFGAITRQEDIPAAARRFLEDYACARRRLSDSTARDEGPCAPIEVRPIAHSDCLQIIDGHHRAAIAWQCGLRAIPAFVLGPAVLTPLQAVLLEGTWLRGRRELYQPVDAPELRSEWLLVRRCEDRLAMMTAFLRDQGLLSSGRPPLSYLDLGCAYGWFVKRLSALGLEAAGVDRDLPALLVGVMAYGLDPSQVCAEDLVEFLRQGRQYDVVSCLSVLHIYAQRTINATPEELVQLLGRAARRVLFVETGGAHENWHGGKLAEWTDDHIENLLRRRTSFREVHRLGKDADGVDHFEGSYNRTLFACLRE
jgi:SAM-dependent methyltransferase